MKRKFLEDLGLEKDVIDKVLDQNSQDIGSYKTQVTELTTERDSLKENLKDRDKQLEKLTEAGSIEDLKQQIADLQETNKQKDEDHKKAIENLKFDTAIEKALSDSKHPDLLGGKIDRTKLKLMKDGSVTGLDEQVNGLKDTYKDLWGPNILGRNPNNPDPSVTINSFDDLYKNADNMSAEEVAAQLAAMSKE